VLFARHFHEAEALGHVRKQRPRHRNRFDFSKRFEEIIKLGLGDIWRKISNEYLNTASQLR
jgi:hypothetical protein